MKVVRTESEIRELVNAASEGMSQGSKFPGQSYEEGILETINWLEGDGDDASPMSDDDE